MNLSRMFFSGFLAEVINIAPIILTATENMVMAMANTGSSLSEVEVAATAYTREFITQIIVTIIAAIAVAYFSFRSWNAGNKFQDVLNATAQARIEEAKAEAAKANEGLSKANAEIIGAKKRTAEISLKVEEESKKRLEAERARLELQARVQPRYLTAKKESEFIAALRVSPVKGNVRLNCILGDTEGNAFAGQISDMLKKAGWHSAGVSQSVYTTPYPKGAFITISDPQNPPAHAEVLRNIFLLFGIELTRQVNKTLEPDFVGIRIGYKP